MMIFFPTQKEKPIFAFLQYCNKYDIFTIRMFCIFDTNIIAEGRGGAHKDSSFYKYPFLQLS